LLTTHLDAINRHRHFEARLPLPFGLVAAIETRREVPASESARFVQNGGTVSYNRPLFPGGLTGGRQLAFRGEPSPGDRPGAQGSFTDPAMPGHVDLAGEYARGVLSTNIATQFDQDFGPSSLAAGVQPRIPLRHYELSGYGASLLSDWRDTNAPGPAIIQARFDVFVGRTAHEIVQMQSLLYPWFVRVTRTITIDRQPGGWVLREDSGWLAASAGLFEYRPPIAEAFPPERRHPGAIAGVERVRNIRLEGPQFPIPVTGGPDSIAWQPVRFDADVVFVPQTSPRLLVASGSALDRVQSRRISGWIQIGGPTFDDVDSSGTTIKRVRPANGTEVFNLLSITGEASAPVSCALLLGGTDTEPGLVFRATNVTVGCYDDPLKPHLAACRT
jgi:hypothetical protein